MNKEVKQKYIKGYKYRIYPNDVQKVYIAQNIGTMRHVYNACLTIVKESYEEDKKFVENNKIDRKPKGLSPKHALKFIRVNKEQYIPWINQGNIIQDSFDLTINNLDSAFEGFFRRVSKGEQAGYPRYKSKYDSHQSFTFRRAKIRFTGLKYAYITLPSINDKKHKELKIVIDRWAYDQLNVKATKNCVISIDPSGKYFISISVDHEKHKPLELKDFDAEKILGIDLGIRHKASQKRKFATFSNSKYADQLKKNTKSKTLKEAIQDKGFIYMPRFYIEAEKKIKFLQKQLSRKQGNKKGQEKSNRWKKQRLRINKNFFTIKSKRKSFIEELTTEITRLDISCVVVKKLNIKQMTKKPQKVESEEEGKFEHNGAKVKAFLNKSILDAGWGIFLVRLEQKCKEKGIHFISVDPHYTSSICRVCNYEDLNNKQNEYFVCKKCGHEEDIDKHSSKYIIKRAIEDINI